MTRTGVITRFVDFCRSGYPDHAPRTGYVPLFALLRRRLSDDEVSRFAGRITAEPPITRDDIRRGITEILHEEPLPDDAERVSRHLVDNGWLVVDSSGRASCRLTRPARAAAPPATVNGELGDAPLVHRLAQLASEVPVPDTIEDFFAELCSAAVELIPGADLADVMLVRGDDVVSIGATSDLATTLDHLQQHHGEGPCAHAVADTTVVRTDDLSTDGRWARYAPDALDLGVRSCLSYTLYRAPTTAATLNIFGFDANAWDDDAESTGAILAAQAGAAITSCRWGADLSSPLVSPERMGQAKGIVMERYGVDDVCAFTMLRTVSTETGQSLADVAQRIIDTCGA